ncbi:restriction endonuclease subunit S [Flavobacterium proteolyticum]|uniref:Restriction endonuclease subunit S n=1 Tax=Flavobacterium proteolyticum TaxID=2911683 RepID=A0ABR9WTK6_9FLAO|nr:restriction endonuclease subunit S [Flavobacterium proteolyticum]MBE9576989.1 restriction endonuclease subunit S [Flavobacterium proteolyticum]
MAQFNISDTVDRNKVFLVKRSELFERLDPDLVLYTKKTQSYKFKTFPLKSLLVKAPQYGANESGIERISSEEPRYIRITDIDEYGLLKDNIGVTAENIEDRFILNENDILFARSGNTVGKAYLHKKANVNYDCFFAGYMIRFIVDDSKILADYLFTYTQLNIYKNWVNAIQRTAGQPNINAEEYKSLLIPLPPKEIQQQIVEKINSAYTQKQQKEAQATALLASIDAYLLKELGITLPEKDTSLQCRIFTTSFSEVSGGRFDGYYYQKDFIEFFNCLKKGIYPIKSLKKISKKITSGITPLSGGDAYTNSLDGVPFIRSGNIDIDGDIDFEDLLYLKKEIHEVTMKSSKVEYNDLMIAIVGATIGQVGIYNDTREANINQAIALVRLKEEINHNYVKEVIKSSIGQYNLNRLKRPVARANINLEEISTMQIILPPKEKQDEIAVYIQNIRAQAKQFQDEAKMVLEEAKREVELMIIG